MNVLKYVLHIVMALGVFLTGCAHEGKFRLRSVSDSGVTIEKLHQNWTDYFIHYSTRVVVYDPIGEPHTIQVGDRWVLIEDSKQLTAIFDRLEISPRFDPTDINEITGPNDDFYGYLIYARGDLISFEKIDENTLRLNYIPQRSPDAP
jgi:hypothetical protein